MGYIAVAMTCWVSAIAAERLTSYPAKNNRGTAQADDSSLTLLRSLYWHALNHNSY
jgi:hypothetical protein